MMSPRSSRSHGRAPFSKARAALALCVLSVLAVLDSFASAGCSSATCYRNTDCPYASDCKQGQCVRRASSEASAGASPADDAAAGSTN